MGAGATTANGAKLNDAFGKAKDLLAKDTADDLDAVRVKIKELRGLLHSQVAKDDGAAAAAEKQFPTHKEDLFKQRLTVYHKDKNIWGKYKKSKTVGYGLCGAVFTVIEQQTKQKFACKSVPKKHVKLIHDLRKEIKMLQTLDHPNIIKMYEAWETKTHIYIILELAEGGDLFDNLLENESYSERQAADIFKQMLRAIQYCHDNGISHRDIKLENFLFCGSREEEGDESEGALSLSTSRPVLKLIDFGLSRRFVGSGIARMRSTVGTSYYVAPEVLKRRPYTNKCDMWSLGVVLFMLLSGKSPWIGETEPEILQAVIKGKFEFLEGDWEGVSDLSKDLVRKLLNVNVNQRLTAVQALDHPWMKEVAPKSTRNKQMGVNVLESLKHFAAYGELKKVVIDVIAFSLDPKLLEESEASFKYIDKDGNGTISVDELQEALLSKGVQPKEVERVFKSLDQDHNGTISFSEFLAATLDKDAYLCDERLVAAFQRLDSDHDGKISISDLKEALGDWYNATEIEKMITEIGKFQKNSTDDGSVDFNTFIDIMFDGEGHFNKHEVQERRHRMLTKARKSGCLPNTSS